MVRIVPMSSYALGVRCTVSCKITRTVSRGSFFQLSKADAALAHIQAGRLLTVLFDQFDVHVKEPLVTSPHVCLGNHGVQLLQPGIDLPV
jgi:hypothetical protein